MEEEFQKYLNESSFVRKGKERRVLWTSHGVMVGSERDLVSDPLSFLITHFRGRSLSVGRHNLRGLKGECWHIGIRSVM